MLFQYKVRLIRIALSLSTALAAQTQSILPPVIPWEGKSESLVAKPTNPWITHAEKTGFVTTPDYNETMRWLKKLTDASPLVSMTSIGKSVAGRDIYMVIASAEKKPTAEVLKTSQKPTLLVQAGIHAGEIDGKDAGMMLLRDIAFGDKKHLLDKVNLLFIPILNVDGHERSSSYNRPNQRGPQNMGWRTNAENLNLNRDYAKQDTREIRAVTKVFNDYNPLLYMDIHVTDGVDYQYDITYGGHGKHGYSPEIADWLESTYRPYGDKDLVAQGHIPGQLLFSVNSMDFSEGTALMRGDPRFSDAYGNLRHMATILVENHSLKPFKQRVLGTYVLLESTMRLLAADGNTLRERTNKDKARRDSKIPLKWKIPSVDGDEKPSGSGESASDLLSSPDSISLFGIESKIIKSAITNSDFVEWTGKPITMTIANFNQPEGFEWVIRPKAYWVPSSCLEVIERLKIHGILMEILEQPRMVEVEMYRIHDADFQNENGRAIPYEGHTQISGSTITETRKELFSAGSARISLDQPLGDLAILLLEPKSPDSYFSWGFFLEIFQRTEYIEAYVMEPTMKKMLDDSPELQKEFAEKKAAEPGFADNPGAIFTWFYSKTKYYDDRYLLYPVGREK